MYIFDIAVNHQWRRAKKTKGLKAKALVNLLVDRTVVNKFLIDTLEAKEPIDSANIFCIGEAGDAWQQTSKALLKKYDVKAIDGDGWMVCEPKPEAEVEFVELDGDLLTNAYNFPHSDGFIRGLWGEEVDGVKNLQRFTVGDFMCRQPHDHSDTWIVRRKLFLNTYTILGE